MRNPARYPSYKHTALGAVLLLAAGGALAHIKNEATQFPDIEFSDARFDIVVLVGAGIVPQTPVFEPDKALSQREMATWIALAEGLLSAGETPDVDALAAAALESNLVDSLEGDAALADLDRLFFGGQLGVVDAERTPTKAEAASLIATQLDTEAGTALLNKRGLIAGATGDVNEIATHEGHHGGNVYVITVGDTTLPMDEHGRVANGPTDLLQWDELSVRRSFVRRSGDREQWIYLEAEPRQATQADDVAVPAAEPAVVVPPADRSLLYWLLAAGVILGTVLFFRRRQSD